MSDESVFVYLPLKFDSENTTSLEESLQRIDNDDEPKSIAVNTLAVNYSYQNWRRWTFEDFQPLHDGKNSVVYKYSLNPPCLPTCEDIKKKTENCVKCVTIKDNTKALWCMSPVVKKQKMENSSSVSLRIKSPTDYSRYKTVISITGEVKNWDIVWKKLCKSLQQKQLENCNAYYKTSKEIVIYHSGYQQTEVGEWIWKNIHCDYSKNTFLVI